MIRRITGLDALVIAADQPPLREGWLAVGPDGLVEDYGSGPPPDLPGERIDGRGRIAVPGLVNAHHHLYQSLTRGRSAGQGLFRWLQSLYPLWQKLTPDRLHVAARVSLAELLLSGTTTTADHHYIYPRGIPAAELDASLFAAAEDLGMRLLLVRGAITCGEAEGCLPPAPLVERADSALAGMQEAIRRYHDPSPAARRRVAVGPVSVMSVAPAFMREAAELAESEGVRLHTHAGETLDEQRYAVSRFGTSPLDLLEEWGWLAERTWLAHGVHIPREFHGRLAERGVGIAHCPSSNLRLGSGVAPIRTYLEAGIRVGLGVDGSSSNDGGHLLGEARQALLLSGIAAAGPPLSPQEALALATRGGAACLGWNELGSLERGHPADVALFRTDDLYHAGMDESDPVAALLLMWPQRADGVLVGGEPVVREARLLRAHEEELAAALHTAMW